MAKQSRSSLASLVAQKPAAIAPAIASPASSPARAETAEKADGRVQVLVRMTPAERKALRQIALDQDTTVQALVEETLRDLLRRHGR